MLGGLLGSLLGRHNATTAEAISTLRRRLGMELSATVYRVENKAFIVTSVMTARGEMSVETGDPTVLPIDVPDVELGEAALRHLVSMVKRRPPNQRDHKLTDWRVYQVSGARSVRSFASHSMRVSLETTPGGLNLSARGTHVVEGQSWATLETSLDPVALGADIRKVIAEAEQRALLGSLP